MSLQIELSIGTKFQVRGTKCEVVEGRSCKDCVIHKLTINDIDRLGYSLKCGYKRITTQGTLCSRNDRSDGKDIIFKEIK